MSSSATAMRCGFCVSITDLILHFDTSSQTRCIAVFTMSDAVISLPVKRVTRGLYPLEKARVKLYYAGDEMRAELQSATGGGVTLDLPYRLTSAM